MEHPKNAGINPRNNKCAVVMMDGISLLVLLLLMVEGLSGCLMGDHVSYDNTNTYDSDGAGVPRGCGGQTQFLTLE